MKKVDARGKLCPIPLIMTKKALLELADNENLEVILDNETTKSNVEHFLRDHKMELRTTQQGKEFIIHVNKTGSIQENVSVEEFCAIDSPRLNNYVITVKRNVMGNGSDELGQMLLKAAINTIPDIDKKPEKMIFFNSGIELTLNNSPVLESLKKIENMGIEILVCGTCLDYFNKKSELAVGRVSNMYDILDAMTKTDKVVFL